MIPAKPSLRRNVFVLLCVVASAFGALVLGWRHLESQRTESLHAGKQRDLERTVSSLLELESKPLLTFVRDYTFWDDLVQFTRAPRAEWALENLDVAVATYGIEGLFVFDTTGKPIYALPEGVPNRVAELPLHPSRFAELFLRAPIAHFFARQDSAWLEVFGARIHRSADPLRAGESFGYFFGVKRWDESILGSLGGLTDSNVTLMDPLAHRVASDSADADENSTDSIAVMHPMPGADGAAAAVLRVEQKMKALEFSNATTNRALALLLGCVLIALIALAAGLYWFFDRPLTAVTTALRSCTLEPLAPFMDRPHEFGELARLVRDSFRQRAEMREEVERRRASEVELERVCRESEETTRRRMRWLAQVSHEIRSPLAGVTGMVDLLADTRLDDPQREFVSTIQTTCAGLVEVLNDVLDLAKIEEGKLVLEQIEFPLRPLVEGVVALFASQAQGKGLEIAQVVPVECASRVRGDPGRLRQILINLVGNAVKYTEQGEIAIEVSTAKNERHDTIFSFVVRDTGIGVKPERLRAIFEEYEQARASDARRYGGTGLGLSICRHLAKMLGGTLEVSSDVGVGSVFTLAVPLGLVPAPALFDETDRHVRVLLLAEHSLTRASLTAQIRSIGCSVEVCADESAVRANLATPVVATKTVVVAEYRPGSAVSLALYVQRQKRSIEGTTASLVVVASLLDALGYEEPGGGAHIVVISRPSTTRTLWRAILDGARAGGDPKEIHGMLSTAVDDFALASKRVLIAESYPPTQRILQDHARRIGLEVVLAADGKSAFDSLTTEHFDAAVVDLRLVVIDGLELARMLREHEVAKRKTRLPIVALNARERDRANWKAAGIDDAVRGTLSASSLKEALERVVVTTAQPSPRR